MRSIPSKFRLPLTLEAIVKSRAKEAGYNGLSEYVLGLIRYDLMCRKPHAATAALAQLSRAEQDGVDIELARLTQTGETMAGSWLETTVRDIVKEMNVEKPETHKLVSEILKRLGGK